MATAGVILPALAIAMRQTDGCAEMELAALRKGRFVLHHDSCVMRAQRRRAGCSSQMAVSTSIVANKPAMWQEKRGSNQDGIRA